MSGEPNFFSRTTFRPFGPIVTFTASARALTPFSSALRESSEKLRSLAMFANTLGLISHKNLTPWEGGRGGESRMLHRFPLPCLKEASLWSKYE